MSEKTHYRKAFDSPYLSSADIVDAVILTVKRVTLELDRTKKTKDRFNTAWFVEREIRAGEPLKPMILNATNSKTLARIAGSKFIDDWNNIQIVVYVDGAVRFGKETVEGLRIRPCTVAPRKQQITDARLNSAITQIKAGNFTVERLLDQFDLTAEQERKVNDETAPASV
ncbi:MAG: hypothetical protein WBC18_20490 [Ottowia sp.]|uniref:hypothetical protein n=1 Tax=Ottowia sp. TaxID=1898956 RepID=UPI003C74D586